MQNIIQVATILAGLVAAGFFVIGVLATSTHSHGYTGYSIGSHLHFQINVFGIPVNPRVFLEGNP